MNEGVGRGSRGVRRCEGGGVRGEGCGGGRRGWQGMEEARGVIVGGGRVGPRVLKSRVLMQLWQWEVPQYHLIICVLVF